jgi:hypothetical protein
MIDQVTLPSARGSPTTVSVRLALAGLAPSGVQTAPTSRQPEPPNCPRRLTTIAWSPRPGTSTSRSEL